MALPQAGRMLYPLRCSLCLILVWLGGIKSSTLHLHQAERDIPPQHKGYFTIDANMNLAGADRGGNAAPVLQLTALGAAERGSDYGAPPPHRSRRSSSGSTMPKVYGQASLNDSHNQMVVHWAGEKSNVIVALARDSAGAPGPRTSSVYVSYDYGSTFTLVSGKFQLPEAKAKDGSAQSISQFYHSPADNKQYIFTDTINNYLWNTFDFCKSAQGFSLPFKPTDLLLHSTSPNLVLGYDGSHPNKQLWKSDDFGETWVLIQEHVKTYFWGVEPYDSPTTVLVQRHEPQGVFTVLSSTDFFQSEQNRKVIMEQADSFQLRDKYMFATTTKINQRLKQLFLFLPEPRQRSPGTARKLTTVATSQHPT